MKHSTSKDEAKKDMRKAEIKTACQAYTEYADLLIERAISDIERIRETTTDIKIEIELTPIVKFSDYGKKFIDLTLRRIVNEERIPHEEKVFSIFEEYTEWLSKGKAGVSQELGKNVCIIEDQFGFFLNYKIMEKETDRDIAVDFTKETIAKFPKIKNCSYDKGYWKPDNKKELANILDKVIMPKKGKLSQKDKEEEFSGDFKKSRHQHSAVESAINALENHGLDRCPDKGIKAFNRYVSYAVLGRNIQILGHIIQEIELLRKKRSEKMKQVKRRVAA